MRKIDAIDPGDRRQDPALGAPDESFGRVERWRRRGRRRQSLERVGDAAKKVSLALERLQGRARFDRMTSALP